MLVTNHHHHQTFKGTVPMPLSHLSTGFHQTSELEVRCRLQWFAAMCGCCVVVVSALLSSTVDSLPFQVEVDVISEFVIATHYANATPVTQGNLCTSWTSMIVCSNDTVVALNFMGANLKGTLPVSLSKLINITHFDASNNSITGSIPHQWSSWGGTIAWVNISFNNLSGMLPPELSNWSSMKRFSFSNNQLNGTLPPEYSGMTGLRFFDVSYNSLSGTLPNEYSRLTNLESFSCQSNRLSGSLPSSWRSLLNMTKFTAGNNGLSGSLPPEYASWSRITSFVVDGNAITGTLPPEYANWTEMDVLVANNNYLSGTLPIEYSEGWSLISYLRIRNNSIHGTLPAEYSKLHLISLLDASSNRLSGTLPPQYAAWKNVTSLSFPNNMLTGTIPVSWSTGMPLLWSLILYNNSLSGTIPSAPPFPSLNVLSISANDFSGSLPSPSTWPHLLILDIQNNTHLYGSAALQQSLSIVSACGTQLCRDAAFTGTYVCVPSGALANSIANGVTLELLVALAAYTVTQRSCSTTSVAPSAAPLSLGKNNATYEFLPTYSINTISGVACAAALGAALSAVEAADAQMLVSILGSPCVCSTTTLPPQQQEESVLLLALSPFSPLGSAWAAIGNSLLCCVVVGLHATAVFMLFAKVPQAIQQPRRTPFNTWLGRWLQKNKSNDSRTRRRIIAQLRFPNVSVTLLMLLVPGVVRACMMTANSFVNPGNDSDGDSPLLSAVAIAIGVLFVLCACGFVEVVAFRHANAEVMSANSRRSGVNHLPREAGEQLLLHFVRHQNPTRLFKPIPRRIALVALPRGAWEPQAARTAYGGVVSSYLAPWRRVWVVVPGANIVVQLLNGVGGDDTTCDALQSITLIALACVCVFIAYARPHRALLASYLVCASLVLTMVTALLGLLCRHGAVSSDAVSGFGVFASVAMFVFKLYHVLMPIVERRLMARNVGLVASPSCAIRPVVSAEAADFNEVSDPRWRRNVNATAAVEEAKVLPLSNEQIEAQRKRLSIEQMKALRELILMVVERSSDGGAQLLL
ncbi:GP46-like surface antigen, putative [Bodo saltans]|uniref:GP46-like surface antigen, putative n=1 Tax=Bodo saltans TaxID=75058 RepID=A0A0S4IL47_BODSA|nr:GP46-like surface antigen, putative [Bodo saltans]|eukprot:CUF20695.1 GP46-like surface antigen, putative [Bodo saltans]